MINTYTDAKANAEKACKADLIGFLEVQLGDRIYLDESLKKYKDRETGAEFFYCHDDGYKYGIWGTVNGKRVKIEGDDAIKYLRTHLGMGFIDAVDALCTYGDGGSDLFAHYRAEEHKKVSRVKAFIS